MYVFYTNAGGEQCTGCQRFEKKCTQVIPGKQRKMGKLVCIFFQFVGHVLCDLKNEH